VLLTKGLGKYRIIYNKEKLQKLQDGINTCGKWIIWRIMMMMNYNMDLAKFLEFVDTLEKKYKLSSDELVSMIIKK
jgi:hypothetical protein